jgi:hypothetical protein
MELQSFYDVVESGIAELGVNPADCRGENPGQWNLKKGETIVWVDLWMIEAENRAYYQVMSPIFPLPADENIKNALLANMLEINDTLFGVAFTVFQDNIYIKVIREADGMDKAESLSLLLRVGNYADLYRAELSEKYGIVSAETSDDNLNNNQSDYTKL